MFTQPGVSRTKKSCSRPVRGTPHHAAHAEHAVVGQVFGSQGGPGRNHGVSLARDRDFGNAGPARPGGETLDAPGAPR